MNIITNGYINFRGLNKVEQKPLSNKEKTKKSMNAALDYIKENAERRVPENGKYTKLMALFDINGTSNEARIAIEYDPVDPKNKRTVTAGVVRKGTDRLYTSYISTGTKKEILEFLNSKECPDTVYKSVKKLSSKVDEYFYHKN